MAGAGVAAAEVCGTPKCQKRPTYVAKESDLHGKRDLHIWQKRPTYMAKEIYKCVKRDLLVRQKTALLHGKRDLLSTSRDPVLWTNYLQVQNLCHLYRS